MRKSLRNILSWIFGVAGATVAGVLVFWFTNSPHSTTGTTSAPSGARNLCDPLPNYLAGMKIMPPSFPSAKVPTVPEFEASGPDPRGRIQEYRWSYEGASKSGKQVEFTLRNRGANIVNLDVKDVSGCTVHRARRILAR